MEATFVETHAMPSSVDLGRKLEDAVSELIRKGRYNSRSEVLREGVRLVQEREARLAALDAALGSALAEVERGSVTDASAVFDGLAARYAVPSRKRGKGPPGRRPRKA